jgi:hypothetical protein
MVEPIDVKLDRIHRCALDADTAIATLEKLEPKSVSEVLTAAQQASQRILNLLARDFSQTGVHGLLENDR